MILVCGGAGYIGSHTVHALVEAGRSVLVVDNLSKGHEQALPAGVALEVGDLRDRAFLDQVFSMYSIEGVIDFAADSQVGESVEKPLKYYENNVAGTLNLLQAMEAYGVHFLVFSSTAATYGEPERIPIQEGDRKEPTNPYGETKLAVERMMHWQAEASANMKATAFSFVALRYFNAAGAHPAGKIGEDHTPEPHLIPLILEVALGKREKIFVFGEDYDTLDGNCIRDYIDVMDLADAHIRALDYLIRGGKSISMNLGNGTGYSVKEVIEAARVVTGHSIPSEVAPRRAGDPAQLVASADLAKKVLGWESKKPGLLAILSGAWNWHQSHPEGFQGGQS